MPRDKYCISAKSHTYMHIFTLTHKVLRSSAISCTFTFNLHQILPVLWTLGAYTVTFSTPSELHQRSNTQRRLCITWFGYKSPIIIIYSNSNKRLTFRRTICPLRALRFTQRTYVSIALTVTDVPENYI